MDVPESNELDNLDAGDFFTSEDLCQIIAEFPQDHPHYQMAKMLLVLKQQEQYEAHIDKRLAECKTPEEQDKVLTDALAAVSEFYTD